jgi:3'5'-cyclic nucleotide phosphodiesterase
LSKFTQKKSGLGDDSSLTYFPSPGKTFLDEFKEVIEMEKNSDRDLSIATGEKLNAKALAELRDYVAVIASMYHNNPFHNFDHACHVAMSVSKLLKRIVTPDVSDVDIEQLHISGGVTGLHNHLHNCTYGLMSDPVAQFAIIFSAVIHDTDHRGCSNVQLSKEEQEMASKYRQKSIAEQNSLELAWNLLMAPQYTNLRKEVFGTRKELLRFRQIVVNSVLATDIFDKELNDLRKARWNKAFSTDESNDSSSGSNDGSNPWDRKATIVIEHIIQASDVSHTMQHWHIYLKWNKNLFHEMYLAYQDGRMGTEPSTFWYQGELSFFDNYVIPLARKLKECQVFGVSSDEYLNYASKF